MMRERRFVAALAAALTAALTAVACTPSSSEPTPPPRGAAFGGVVRVAIGDPGSVDPANAYEPNAELVTRTMCDTLVRADPTTGELVPGLAASWLVSDGGTRITVRLSRDARFHNGKRITAADVARSLTRVASPQFAGATAELLRPIDGFAELRGERKGRSDLDRRRLRGVQPVTGEAVEIVLSRPNADFLAVLTHPISAVVDGRGQCAGPYVLDGPWRAGKWPIVLERNRRYSGPEPGLADRIEFVPATPAAPDGAVTEVAGVDDPSTSTSGRVVTGAAPSVEYVGFPLREGSIYRSTELRRALSLALDRTALAAPPAAGGMRRPATGFLPPALGRAAERSPACAAAVPPRPDVEAARRLLATAGIDASAVVVPLTFNDELGNRAVAEAVAGQWRSALGLNVELRAVTYDEFVSGGEGQEGFPGPFRMSWAVAYPSVDAWLQPLFSTEGIGQANFGRFSSGRFDRRLLRGAREATDRDDRAIEYRKLEDELCTSMPMLPLTTDVRAWKLPSTVAPAGEPAVDGTTGLVRLRALAVTAGT